MTARPPLVTDHWFREGPGLPDGSDGYWICGICGGHRGDHVQAEGAWRKPLHAFVLQRNFPSHCRTCGRRRRHTVHAPLWWATVKTPAPTRPEEES
jgi:hypothetical protein